MLSSCWTRFRAGLLLLSVLGVGLVGCAGSSASTQTAPNYDTPPRLQGALSDIQQRISYPESARQHRVTGMVMVELTIAPDGTVAQAHITRSPDWDDAPVATVAALEREALRVARTLTFTPATRNGVPVQSNMGFPVNFTLD